MNFVPIWNWGDRSFVEAGSSTIRSRNPKLKKKIRWKRIILARSIHNTQKRMNSICWHMHLMHHVSHNRTMLVKCDQKVFVGHYDPSCKRNHTKPIANFQTSTKRANWFMFSCSTIKLYFQSMQCKQYYSYCVSIGVKHQTKLS